MIGARETLTTADIAAVIPNEGADLITISRQLGQRAGRVRRGLETMIGQGSVSRVSREADAALYIRMPGVISGPIDVPVDNRKPVPDKPFVEAARNNAQYLTNPVRLDGTEIRTSLRDIQGDELRIRAAAKVRRGNAVRAAAKKTSDWASKEATRFEKRVLARHALEIEIAAMRDAAELLEKNLPKIRQPQPAKTAA